MTPVTKFGRRSLMRGMTLQMKVTGQARMRVCIWIGVRLLHLASIVMGPKAVIAVELRGPE
ncbi:hypothetical protein ACFSGX_13945 [Sphingomonas arantia]|uniref:Uncharacterized protein n=1 Tax=Sphingomonas arantia TaxID=1460676 RepID=A0ABW4U2A0_9SPHN